MSKGTALITGASSGIGEAYARILAKQGYNLILTARRADRLTQLAEELSAEHGINAEGIPADLADRDGMSRVEERIKACDDLTMLINNAGFGVGGSFAEADLVRLQAMADVHMTATFRLTHAALSGMIARNEGAIINVSSIVSFIKGGGSPMYSATKLFLNSFSQNLQHELKETNIKIQALCPGYTYTEFHDQEDYKLWSRESVPSFLWYSSEEVVNISLASLKRGKVIVVPGWPYKILRVVMNIGLTNLISRVRSHGRAEK